MDLLLPHVTILLACLLACLTFEVVMSCIHCCMHLGAYRSVGDEEIVRLVNGCRMKIEGYP